MVLNFYGENEKLGSTIRASSKEYAYYVQLIVLKL
jgi:hypothetical protein